MRRIAWVLVAAALLTAMLGSSALPAAADVDFEHDGIFDDDDGIFGEEGIFGDDDDDDGDDIDDVDVEGPFLRGDDVCVVVVIEFEDGTTDTDVECEDVF